MPSAFVALQNGTGKGLMLSGIAQPGSGRGLSGSAYLSPQVELNVVLAGIEEYAVDGPARRRKVDVFPAR